MGKLPFWGMEYNLRKDDFLLFLCLFLIYRWLMTSFRNNGHLLPNQLCFNNTLSSSRQIVELAFSRLKGRRRKLSHLNHLSVKLMTKVVMEACVLHNFTLVHDNFDESYFLDDDDGNCP